jgi:insulysin
MMPPSHPGRLPNNLKALIVSDPSSERSAAAMSVRVGASHDPEAAPGVAHFTEHMLFLGTERYPRENHYKDFINR